MFHFKPSLLFSFISLVLAGGLALTPLGAGQTPQRSDSQPSAQENNHVRAIVDDDEDVEGQEDANAKRRDDPCEHLTNNPDQASGIDKKCARGGGSSGIAKGDFNGDGFGDLAVGVPGENIGDDADAGAVNIIYGSTHGLAGHWG